MELKLYYCETCKSLIEVLNANSTVKVTCCGKDMKKIEPNTVDAAIEKHIPFVNIEDNSLFISVGEVLHPMTEEHYIYTIYVLDDLGNMQKISFKPTDSPEVSVSFNENAKKLRIYSYCNIHGLWLKEIEL